LRWLQKYSTNLFTIKTKIMDKKVVFGTLAGAVTLFVLGGAVFGFLLKDYMNEWMTAFGDVAYKMEEAPWMTIVGANILLALLLSLLFSKLGISTFQGGLMNGLWILIILYLWFDMWMFATFKPMTTNMMLIDVASNTVVGSIAAGVIGWINGMVK